MQTEAVETKRRRPAYGVIFLLLIGLTLLELVVAGNRTGLPGTSLLLLMLTFTKASLVAAFYMHLRGDSRIYTTIFVLPVLLFVIFALLTIVI
jgi:heme/copper-type cytochrome/quinol oxidase subunit 4